ncbi:hypothetical protein [Croceicoccus marinus]|uniref:Terminase small subunit n=1 Tax=Croceicoccus marinus TaxID=450378 RepID=A0A1Z1FCB8_9SPHN|nr:hypothetical protein [Croceicoccus marinus]ARU16478.1 hypothetical protein A9D14_10155 [Croceicoccus marinus]
MTIDKSRPPLPAVRGTLPEFTPVPRHYKRHDGWTPERQRRFIEALADSGSVKRAAHAVNMTPEGAYLLRRHKHGEEFRKAWEAALALGVQRLEDAAMERAIHGVEVPVYHFGQIVGTRRVYNDRLLMFLLRNRAPERFAADGAKALSAVDAAMLARLKREWRAEWEAEQAEKDERREAELIDSINRKLDAVRERMTHDASALPQASRSDHP